MSDDVRLVRHAAPRPGTRPKAEILRRPVPHLAPQREGRGRAQGDASLHEVERMSLTAKEKRAAKRATYFGENVGYRGRL